MKKGKIIGLAIVASAIIGVGALGYSFYTTYINPKSPLSEEEKKKFEELEKKFESVVDKSPDDIVIPPTATDEEKKVLQEEKDYWLVNSRLKELCRYKNSEMFKTYKIERLIFNPENNSILCFNEHFLKRRVKNEQGVYTHDECKFFPTMKEIFLKEPLVDFSLSGIAKALNEENIKSTLNHTGTFPYNTDEVCKALLEHNLYESIERPACLGDKAYQFESSLPLSNDLHDYPRKFLFIVSTNENENKLYHLFWVDATSYGPTNEEQLLAYIKTNPTRSYCRVDKYVMNYTDVDFDWVELSEKYNANYNASIETANASATSDFEEKDEQGNVVGFDYPAYLESQTKKENLPDVRKNGLVAENDNIKLFSME